MGQIQQFAILLALICGLSTTYQVMAQELSDPTRPSGYAQSRSSGLQTTMISPGKRVAIIDGRKYQVGDRYGKAVVKQIEAHQVVFEQQGKIFRLRMVPKVKR